MKDCSPKEGASLSKVAVRQGKWQKGRMVAMGLWQNVRVDIVSKKGQREREKRRGVNKKEGLTK